MRVGAGVRGGKSGMGPTPRASMLKPFSNAALYSIRRLQFTHDSVRTQSSFTLDLSPVSVLGVT